MGLSISFLNCNLIISQSPELVNSFFIFFIFTNHLMAFLLSQRSYGGSLIIIISFLYLMYLLYHKIFYLSISFFKIFLNWLSVLSSDPTALGSADHPLFNFVAPSFILCTYYNRCFLVCQEVFLKLFKFFYFLFPYLVNIL